MSSTRSPRGLSLAVACISSIALAAGAMYIAQKESKSTEGDKSIFHDRSRGSDGKGDARMNSADVRQAMHKAPGKD